MREQSGRRGEHRRVVERAKRDETRRGALGRLRSRPRPSVDDRWQSIDRHACGRDLPGLHREEERSDRVGEVRVVRRDEHGRTRRRDVVERRGDESASRGIQPSRGLVDEQHARCRGELQRDGEASALADGEIERMPRRLRRDARVVRSPAQEAGPPRQRRAPWHSRAPVGVARTPLAPCRRRTGRRTGRARGRPRRRGGRASRRTRAQAGRRRRPRPRHPGSRSRRAGSTCRPRSVRRVPRSHPTRRRTWPRATARCEPSAAHRAARPGVLPQRTPRGRAVPSRAVGRSHRRRVRCRAPPAGRRSRRAR